MFHSTSGMQKFCLLYLCRDVVNLGWPPVPIFLLFCHWHSCNYGHSKVLCSRSRGFWALDWQTYRPVSDKIISVWQATRQVRQFVRAPPDFSREIARKNYPNCFEQFWVFWETSHQTVWWQNSARGDWQAPIPDENTSDRAQTAR